MEHLFNDIEKKIIEKLKNSKPKRIWYEFITVVFEFDDFYIELESVSEIADSQNKYDEAIAAKIREFKKAYKPSKNAKLISKNKLISEIKTVKTFLYFTDSISEPKKVKKLDSKWNRFMSKISNVKQSETEKILGGTSSSYHSVIIYIYIIIFPALVSTKVGSTNFSRVALRARVLAYLRTRVFF